MTRRDDPQVDVRRRTFVGRRVGPRTGSGRSPSVDRRARRTDVLPLGVRLPELDAAPRGAAGSRGTRARSRSARGPCRCSRASAATRGRTGRTRRERSPAPRSRGLRRTAEHARRDDDRSDGTAQPMHVRVITDRATRVGCAPVVSTRRRPGCGYRRRMRRRAARVLSGIFAFGWIVLPGFGAIDLTVTWRPGLAAGARGGLGPLLHGRRRRALRRRAARPRPRRPASRSWRSRRSRSRSRVSSHGSAASSCSLRQSPLGAAVVRDLVPRRAATAAPRSVDAAPRARGDRGGAVARVRPRHVGAEPARARGDGHHELDRPPLGAGRARPRARGAPRDRRRASRPAPVRPGVRGVAAGYLGLVSFAWEDAAGGFGRAWSAAAMAWGAALAAVALVDGARGPRAPSPRPTRCACA